MQTTQSQASLEVTLKKQKNKHKSFSLHAILLVCLMFSTKGGCNEFECIKKQLKGVLRLNIY